MDAKVKSMIKLIEQDADSFASRAEMYYEKRPELMKMVEEFYRAYRALAERYDHATGALRQATEAFPKEVPSEITEDELEICANEKFVEKFGSLDDKNFGEQRVERGFDIIEEKEKIQKKISTVKFDKGIQTLSEVLAKFEAEKEFSLAKYSQSLEKLSHQEGEFFNAQESSKDLVERANKAEDEVETLSKAIRELEFEKERSHLQYQKCLKKIENMEETISIAQKDIIDLNERAYKAETESLTLKLDLAYAESENATSLDQCKHYSEKILDLETKLMMSEDEVKKLNKRAEEAEREAETYKHAFMELGMEKEATAVQYQQCLDTVSSLKTELSCAQEEVLMLDEKVKMGVDLLKGAKELSLDLEKSNKSLNNELETLKLEMAAQSEELTEKKREMDILNKNIEEEKMRFVESETAFQMLQLLQGQTEKELNSLTLDLEQRSLTISDLETRNQSLINEALKMTEDNKILNQQHVASSVCIKDMQGEILRLKEAKEKLEDDVECGIDQRSALEQEIHCLTEQLDEHNKRYYTILNENLNIKEIREREDREKKDLLKKLEDFEKVVEKNSLLEKSISDLNADLEGAREEIIAMVKSIQSLFEEKIILDTEKESLVNRLQVVNENLEKLLEKSTFMEISISNAHCEIEELQMKLKGIENEKLDLNNDKVTLVSQMKINGQRLKDIEENYRELEEKHSVLEKEKETTLCEVQELRLIVKESKLKGDKKMIEIENLHRKVMHMQKISVALQEENLKLIDEKISLVKDLLDLQNKNNTFEEENLSILCETASLSNLSLIFKNIINEKGLEIKELNGAHKSLEEETTAKDRNIEMLKERISILEGENGEIKAQLAGYVPAISSLKGCISSLERSTSAQLRTNSDEKLKTAIENHDEGQEESITDHKVTDKASELQELEARVKTVEEAVIENNSKLEAATRQIEDNMKPLSVDSELQNGLLAKDIKLDQVSNMNSEETITTLTKKAVRFNSIIEKELGVDKAAAANKHSLPDQKSDKTITLNKLISDSLKLGNLQTTVQDLKRRAEMSEKIREGISSSEYENVKKRLEKAEEETKQLSYLNGKLMKSVDKSDDVKDVVQSEENVTFSEQAGTVLEGIGKLEFEMQKIQYIMLKLDDGTEKENKSEITKSKRSSIRNYLGLNASNKAKKKAFCGFAQPSTIEE